MLLSLDAPHSHFINSTERLRAKHVHMPGLRTGDAIRSQSATLNPKALHLKEERQINNNVIQAIHYGIIEEKVIVFICGDLFVGQIYESSSTELNMGERAEFC